MNLKKNLTYNKTDVIITLASNSFEDTKLHEIYFADISLFLFLIKKKKQGRSPCYKDYSLFFSWVSSLSLLSSNNTINRQINSYEDTILHLLSQRFPLKRLCLIIIEKLQKYNEFFKI